MVDLPILLIFDIDGTLCRTGGLGRIAFELTFSEIYNVDNAAEGVLPFGRTDAWIFRDIVKRQNISIPDFDAHYEVFIKQYIAHFKRLSGAWEKSYLYPGVKLLLDKLNAIPNVFMALGTGNVDQVAYIKLNKLGIDKYFPIGGFGNDSENRTEILRIAHKRAEIHYGVKFTPNNHWVIGDTDLDIISGKESGALTIAVGTGGVDVKELEQQHPTALFSDFSDSERFIDVVLKFSEARTNVI